MKLCRYDDDRLGVVRGDLVHDVTEAQTDIRKSAPYAMKGDAVIGGAAAMARAHRTHGRQGRRQTHHVGQVAPAGGAADQIDLRTDQLSGAYRGDGQGIATAGLTNRAR